MTIGTQASTLCLFVELVERLPVFSFPRGKSVCAPAVYNYCSSRWARTLGILCEDQDSASLDERTIGNELFALGHDVRILVGRRALVQHCGRTTKYHEAVRRALASSLCSFVTAE